MAWYAKGRPLHGVCFKNAMGKMGFSPCARLRAGIVKIIADGRGDVKPQRIKAASVRLDSAMMKCGRCLVSR